MFAVENAKIFRSYVKHFWISHVKEIVESWLVYINKFSWVVQLCFLTETIKSMFSEDIERDHSVGWSGLKKKIIKRSLFRHCLFNKIE